MIAAGQQGGNPPHRCLARPVYDSPAFSLMNGRERPVAWWGRPADGRSGWRDGVFSVGDESFAGRGDS